MTDPIPAPSVDGDTDTDTTSAMRAPRVARAWPLWLRWVGRLAAFLLVMLVTAALMSLPALLGSLSATGNYKFTIALPAGAQLPPTLRAASADGQPVSASCQAVADSPTNWECLFSGTPEGLRALQDAAVAELPQAKFESFEYSHVPAPGSTSILSSLAMAPALLLILYWRRRDGEPRWPRPFAKRWLLWLPMPLVAGMATGALLGTEEKAAMEFFAHGLATAPVSTVLMVVLLAPLLEELLFRGVGWSLLRPRYSFAATMAWTAVPFALLHFTLYGVAGVLGTLVLGVTLGWLRERSGSVAVPMLAHALNNGVALMMLAFVPEIG